MMAKTQSTNDYPTEKMDTLALPKARRPRGAISVEHLAAQQRHSSG